MFVAAQLLVAVASIVLFDFVLQQASVATWMRLRTVLFKWRTLQFLILVWNILIFVIAGNFDEIRTRSGLILLILQPKLRERKETNNS